MIRSTRRRLFPVLGVILAAATAGSVNAESASIAAAVTVVPLEITLDLSTLDAKVGETVRVRATISNAGPARLANVLVELRVDTSGLGVRGGLLATIARLQPGTAAVVTWNVCPSRTGNYLVLARASIGDASIESETRLLTVAGQRRRGCT